LQESGKSYSDLESLLINPKGPSQPEEVVKNSDRRRQGVLERRENAPSKDSITRERSIYPGSSDEILQAKAYLRSKYSNSEGQLICQCCHLEMPFKVRDEYYFEAIQCIRSITKHYFENRLALCPTCAAMYIHAKKTDDAELRRIIEGQNDLDSAASAEIQIILAGRKFQLRFVGTHMFDLRTVLAGS
jgi:hypothetical protein